MLDSQKKNKGAFYTSGDVSSYLVDRIFVSETQKILEPSFGDGSFVNPIIDFYRKHWSLNMLKKNFFGIEIQEESISKYKNNIYLDPEKIIMGDFLSIEPFPVDVVIGNPPYIGLNKLSVPEQKSAQSILDLHNFNMQRNGSLWFPFVLHSCAFLKDDGSIAFVLPFELTYVRYAKQLWKFLGSHFSELTVVRVFEDIFPDVDVETVLLIGKGFGGSTNFVNYELYSDKVKLYNGMIDKEKVISIESILSGSRPFVLGLLDDVQLNLINDLRTRQKICQINDYCKFKIGYVSADQKFFHPSHEDIKYFGLREKDLVTAISNAKVLKNGMGLFIKRNAINTKLFLPLSKKIDKNANNYIQHGIESGVNLRYKCARRNPWYLTPGIEIPDIVLTVFGDRAGLYINSDGVVASNSLLCGFSRQNVKAETIATCWYNNLTQLSIELKIHSLGGGVLVFIPGEADLIEILNPSVVKPDKKFLKDIDQLIMKGRLDDAYLLGDDMILKKHGFSPENLCLIRDAVNTLRQWRNSKFRKYNHSDAISRK